MEIIKQGNKNLVECLDCESQLKFDLLDVERKSYPPTGYDMEGHIEYFIHCPCGSHINVTSRISSNQAKRIKELEEVKKKCVTDYL